MVFFSLLAITRYVCFVRIIHSSSAGWKASSKKLAAENGVASVCVMSFECLDSFLMSCCFAEYEYQANKKNSLGISPRCQKVPRKMIRSIASGYLSNTLYNICNEKERKVKTELTRALWRKGRTCKVNIWSCYSTEWKESKVSNIIN